MAAGDEDPPLNPSVAVADITDRDVSAARGDNKEEDPRIPPSKKRHGHQGDGLQQLVARLPDDVLADVLGRLAPRWLAASRCVCKAWRDAVDDHRLLRADLLPLSLAGIFVHFDMHRFPELFSPSSSLTGARAVSGDLDFLSSADARGSRGLDDGHVWNYVEDDFDENYVVQDHCNGLLLLEKYVVNPATRQWSTLPPRPPKHVTGMQWYHEHLVFDPTVSPHYEVFMVPYLYTVDRKDVVDPLVEESEWPPPPYKMHVFSSRSDCWEERSFVREGDAAGTVGEMRQSWWPSTAVYWRGALYLHRKTDFVMRLSLSNNKYRVIKPPMGIRVNDPSDRDLVRSEKGVYFVSLDKCWLQVWILNESCGQMEWTLKHDKDLKHVLACNQFDRGVHGPWILEDINYNLFLSSEDYKKVTVVEEFEWNLDKMRLLKTKTSVEDCYLEDSKEAIVEEKFEWNSTSDDDVENEDMVEDCCFENKKKTIVKEKLEWNFNNDNALDDEDMVGECHQDEEPYDGMYSEIKILGFHPYKEIVLIFSISAEAGLAYHLNSSKLEVLGSMYPKNYHYFKELLDDDVKIRSSFPYTPCWIEEFPRNN